MHTFCIKLNGFHFIKFIRAYAHTDIYKHMHNILPLNKVASLNVINKNNSLNPVIKVKFNKIMCRVMFHAIKTQANA